MDCGQVASSVLEASGGGSLAGLNAALPSLAPAQLFLITGPFDGCPSPGHG